MKPLSTLLIALTICSLCGENAWAEPVIIQCVGETGEASFSPQPCKSDTGTQDRQQARFAAHDSHLEQLESVRMEIVRKLMDLEREYEFMKGRGSIDEEPELTVQFNQQSMSLESELRHLDKKRMQLLGKSFNEAFR